LPQGTIKHYDEGEGSGSLLTDDRTEVAIDRGSTEGSGILTLRIGQRVRFTLVDADDGPVARQLRLVTFD
jgi:cold shock CspA family protein